MSSYLKDTTFNPGRQIAYGALVQTIDECYQKPGVTEKQVHALWFEKLNAHPDIAADGWYSPPPLGMAVLFGKPELPSRINFNYLREAVNYPSDRVIDWNNDLLYAYASPVYLPTGIPGDVQVTLYFGSDQKIIDHFKDTRAAAERIFKALGDATSSGALFSKSQAVFKDMGLRSNVVSKTGEVSLNLGHTLPQLGGLKTATLTPQQKDYIRTARGFINDATDWEFKDGLHFTIEPQLVSVKDAAMPQVTFHFIAKKQGDKAFVCTDVDGLLSRFGLL